MTDEQLAEIRARLAAGYMVNLPDSPVQYCAVDSMLADISALLADNDRLREIAIGLHHYYPAGTGMYHNAVRRMLDGSRS